MSIDMLNSEAYTSPHISIRLNSKISLQTPTTEFLEKNKNKNINIKVNKQLHTVYLQLQGHL